MATTKYDVGGYEVAAEISGEGSPTVVFVSGSGDAGESWEPTVAVLRSSTTLLTYARAGIGDSGIPTTDTPLSLGNAAEELHRLLAATGLPGPFIVAGHSIGGLIALIYGAQWPENLAGYVLVDATDIHLDLDIAEPYLTIEDGDHVSYDVAATAAEVTRSRHALGVPGVVIASRADRWLETDPEPWKPFTLPELADRWQRHHQTLATDLGATLKVAQFGGHYIQQDDPTIVADSIDELTELARE